MYEGITNFEEGHGESSNAELAELRKALDIGTSQPVTGTGPDALRVESLEQTLKLLTYGAVHLRLWNMIPKTNAFSTVEEYNRLVEYGSEGGGFVPSGVLPEEDDTTYERADQKVKYLGTTRSVTHPSTLVRTVPPDLLGQETQNGALWLMKKANRGLYYGDENNISLEYNGVKAQIESGGGNVIDLAGQSLAEADIENGAQLIIDNFGTPSSLFSNPKVFTDFSKLYHDRQRAVFPSGAEGTAGTPINSFNTLSGLINFQPDTFVKKGSAPDANPSSGKAPNAPTITIGSPGSNAASKFVTADNGDYLYKITAVNRYGESAPSAAVSAVTMAAGEGVAITIADGGGAFTAESYKIYRSNGGGTTYGWINLQIPRTKAAGIFTSPTVWTDVNEWRPFTFVGMMLDMSNQSLTFRQLAPMMKMNLAIISPAIRWMQLLYGTPIVYAPKKNVVYKNIGVAT